MAANLTGILSRSGLGRFSLARKPSATTAGTVPCPYIPSSIADRVMATYDPAVYQAGLATLPLRQPINSGSYATSVASTDSLIVANLAASSQPARQPAAASAGPATPEAVDTVTPRTSGAGTAPATTGSASSVSHVPLQATDSDPAKAVESASSFPAKKVECR